MAFLILTWNKKRNKISTNLFEDTYLGRGINYDVNV